MISRGLKFGDGKTKEENDMISIDKHEHCKFKVQFCAVLYTAFAGKTVIFLSNVTPAGRK